MNLALPPTMRLVLSASARLAIGVFQGLGLLISESPGRMSFGARIDRAMLGPARLGQGAVVMVLPSLG